MHILKNTTKHLHKKATLFWTPFLTRKPSHPYIFNQYMKKYKAKIPPLAVIFPRINNLYDPHSRAGDRMLP